MIKAIGSIHVTRSHLTILTKGTSYRLYINCSCLYFVPRIASFEHGKAIVNLCLPDKCPSPIDDISWFSGLGWPVGISSGYATCSDMPTSFLCYMFGHAHILDKHKVSHSIPAFWKDGSIRITVILGIFTCHVWWHRRVSLPKLTRHETSRSQAGWPHVLCARLAVAYRTSTHPAGVPSGRPAWLRCRNATGWGVSFTFWCGHQWYFELWHYFFGWIMVRNPDRCLKVMEHDTINW